MANMSLDHLSRQVRNPLKAAPAKIVAKIWFERAEFDLIMSLYGRGLLAGAWKDYAIDDGPESVVFSMFRRASENPLYAIEKRPALADKQGQWCVLASAGQVLKRGHELRQVLDVLERKLLKLAD
jgi:Protein of unknown function (DUF2794)